MAHTYRLRGIKIYGQDKVYCGFPDAKVKKHRNPGKDQSYVDSPFPGFHVKESCFPKV